MLFDLGLWGPQTKAVFDKYKNIAGFKSARDPMKFDSNSIGDDILPWISDIASNFANNIREKLGMKAESQDQNWVNRTAQNNYSVRKALPYMIRSKIARETGKNKYSISDEDVRNYMKTHNGLTIVGKQSNTHVGADKSDYTKEHPEFNYGDSNRLYQVTTPLGNLENMIGGVNLHYDEDKDAITSAAPYDFNPYNPQLKSVSLSSLTTKKGWQDLWNSIKMLGNPRTHSAWFGSSEAHPKYIDKAMVMRVNLPIEKYFPSNKDYRKYIKAKYGK